LMNEADANVGYHVDWLGVDIGPVSLIGLMRLAAESCDIFRFVVILGPKRYSARSQVIPSWLLFFSQINWE
jgi:hypothetical protein